MADPSATSSPAPDHASAHSSRYQEYARERVQERLRLADAEWDDVTLSMQYDRLRLVFNGNAKHAANTLIIGLVPLYAAALALLRATRREPAGHHIAFALHYLAFSLLFFVLVGVLLAGARTGPIAEAVAGDSPVIPAVVLSVLAVYLVAAFRVAYRTGRTGAVLHAAVIMLLFFPFIDLYRLGLFLVVLRSI